MAQAAFELAHEQVDRDADFRAAQLVAFRHMAAGWYGANIRAVVKAGVEELLAACDTWVSCGNGSDDDGV